MTLSILRGEGGREEGGSAIAEEEGGNGREKELAELPSLPMKSQRQLPSEQTQ